MNASSPAHSILEGYVHHIISSGNCGTKNNGSKKRPRPWEGNDEGSIDKSNVGPNYNFHKGFVFVPKDREGIFIDSSDKTHDGDHPNGHTFPLVIPFQCLKVACDAAATRQLIRISQYSLINYRDGWGELIYSSREYGSRNHRTDCAKPGCDDSSHRNFVTIEVHHDGLSFISSQNKDHLDNNEKGRNDVPSMTLDILAQKEAQNQQTKGTQNKKKKSKAFGKDPMNVSGIVDAISPILVNDAQENPFAIMELYQPPVDEADTDVKSAVVVIRGELALCMHPAIHPGQSITLIGVVSRKWQVPSEFEKRINGEKLDGDGSSLYQRLNQRVPDRVISVTEASAICWNGDIVNSLDMPLPSTVESLTSIRGIVQSVHYHCNKLKDGRKAGYLVHFVTLKLFSPTNDTAQAKKASVFEKEAPEEHKLARVYLPKYAMPPNLALGMQPGAILRAVNIHFISNPNNTEKCQFSKQMDALDLSYVACLRSTLAIERCAGESNPRARSAHPWFIPIAKPFTLVPDHRITDICSDPFNTKSSSQYFAEERLRRELESKLNDASTSFTDSTNLEHAQLPIDGENSHDSKSADQNMHNPLSIDTKLDVLLAHHHRHNSFGKLSNEEGQSKGFGQTKRKSKHVSCGKNGRQTMRDPYAEFFDHAHNMPFNNETECGSSCNNFASYNHYHHPTSTNMPLVAGLDDLRNACTQNFINQVAISVRSKLQSRNREGIQESSRTFSGWSSSHTFQELKLCQIMNDYTRSKAMADEIQRGNVESKSWHDVPLESINIYSWGNLEVTATDRNHEIGTAIIYDSECAIPVCEIRNEMLGNDSPTLQLENNGSPTWAQLYSVCASCLCIGPSQKEGAQICSNLNQEAKREESYSANASFDISPHEFLPSMFLVSKMAGIGGHGFVFRVEDLVFIASVHIIAKSMVSMDRSSSLGTNSKASREIFSPQKQAKLEKSGIKMAASSNSMSSITNRSDLFGIQQCLEQTASTELRDASASIIGRLVRKRFKFRKVKLVQRAAGENGVQRKRCYEGFSIILSHIDHSANNVTDVASVMQTIEVKISVPFCKSTEGKLDALNLALLRLFNSDAKDACQVRTKVVTPDQATMGMAWWVASEASRTMLLLSRGWDEGSDQILTGKKTIPPSIHVQIPLASRTFSKLGYQRFQCDLHDIKSSHVFEPFTQSQVGFSASAYSASSSARVSLTSRQDSESHGTAKFLPGMLNRRLCRVPPLIFNIHQGCKKKEPLYHQRNRKSCLTWLKCEGGVPSATLAKLHWDICASLKEGDHAHLQPSLLRRVHNAKILGISFCRARVECTKCFKVLANGCCPSGCTGSHAAVKWECSVVIDDGTGQAKVYAERESALLLLGGSLDVATIENGAWEMNDGVFFQPALPASFQLIESIRHATMKTRKRITESKLNKKEKICKENLPSAFSFLPVGAKAEYLLHKHCRQWYHHHHNRKMDLFCRCKPLSENVTSVNQTEIQVAKAWVAKMGLDFGAAPTATLPPLKLTLEDACLASEVSYDDNAAGWNLLRS